MAAESFLMCICFRRRGFSPQSNEKSPQRQWVMRKRHKINSLNSHRICDLTIAFVKVKILLSYCIYFACTTQRNEVYLWCFLMSLTLWLPVSSGVSYSYVQGQAGDEDAAVDVKLYSHRWRRWVPPKPRNMDSNRASQEQDQEPVQEEPDGFPGLLSAEDTDTDNSSQIEVRWWFTTRSHSSRLIRPHPLKMGWFDYLKVSFVSRLGNCKKSWKESEEESA